jgi:hypothetical protein
VPGFARAAALLFLTVTLFSSVARAGSRYFFCEVMGEARSAPCCHQESTPAPHVDVDCACCRAHAATVPPALQLGLSKDEAAAASNLDVPVPNLCVGLRPLPAPWGVRPRTRPPRPPDFKRLMVLRN